ncbi:MAG: PAS domain-containing sensor histidine kinase [Comamonas sp. SCN 65-56]|uniref:nitrogen regulation protein NR(II) n=1 Tax=Comamonas sp. SCN 65-56 TaxID=1660095 RepID=UPI00086E41DF|nr:nitrogen regulation protein NR(II) [Comamonas sp. SCN 65-56]ODS91567.1 MAG: PAS domain-containing sensor histidine kinase [Comamonas sp. SCN 65-56]
MALAPDPHAQEAYDRLATLVALVRADGSCLMVNMALENTLCLPRSRLVHGQAAHWFNEPALLHDALRRVVQEGGVVSRFAASLCCVPPGPQALAVHVTVSPFVHASQTCALVEMTELEQQSRLDREQRARELATAHKELLRNLAHEVKNPLGGIRGAAQLLALDHPDGSAGEYAGVIVREVDRLQALVDRLLAPHQAAPAWAVVNIHEVCEHVRTLVLAEFARGLEIQRDYDASLPELRADREQLIQALLNIVRNAAQALAERIRQGDARIVLRTRIAHQATLAGRRHRLALELEVEDNGPGVPPALRERIFQPLVTGRPEGTGLGLTLTQTLVQQQGGSIACESRPGATRFTMVLPLPEKS